MNKQEKMFLHNRMRDLVQRYPRLAVCQADIENAYAQLAQCFHNGNKMLICGNGGSAADSEHWAAELLKGFELRRPVGQQQAAALPDSLAEKLQMAFPVIPLTGFFALSSAFANDVDAEYTFAQLTWALGAPGDVLVCISTSGNSKNVCHAADAARAKGMTVLALTGEKPSLLAEKAMLTIRVPETSTWKIQELHLPVYHCLSLMLEQEFFGQ
jgi:D-sedoheptulose 7-phosphate isomerase